MKSFAIKWHYATFKWLWIHCISFGINFLSFVKKKSEYDTNKKLMKERKKRDMGKVNA